jgi:ACT domain-containing protein
MEQVAQHLPLDRVEITALEWLAVGLVDRVLDLVAERCLMILTIPRQRRDPPSSSCRVAI